MRGVRDGWAKIGQVPDRTGDRVAAGAVHEVRSATSVLRQTELVRRKLKPMFEHGMATHRACALFRCFGSRPGLFIAWFCSVWACSAWPTLFCVEKEEGWPGAFVL